MHISNETVNSSEVRGRGESIRDIKKKKGVKRHKKKCQRMHHRKRDG